METIETTSTTTARAIPPRRVTAAIIIGWIERHCFAPEGRLVGKPIKLAPFQKQFIVDVYDNPRGSTRRAILSMGRKNGKSALIACLLLNHLCGPSAKDRPNSQLYSCAQSREQAGIVFALACKMVRMNPVLANAVRIQETAKSLVCAELGTKYRALSSEANTALGLSPQVYIFDELGASRGPEDPLFEAMDLATAGVEDPLCFVISTQAPTENALLSTLIDDAQQDNDSSTVLHLHTAPLDMDPYSEAAVRAANPAFDHFMNREETLRQAAEARRMPARSNEYRNKILNQRVEAVNPLFSPDVWSTGNGEPMDFTGCTVVGGIDLSRSNDMTALTIVHQDPRDALLHVKSFFWLPAEGIYLRNQRDQEAYMEYARQGLIELIPGPIITYDFIAVRIRDIFDTYDVKQIAFDKWKFNELKLALMQAGFSEEMIKDHFVEFRQGFESMNKAVWAIEQAVLSGDLRHGGNPVLTACVYNTIIDTDAAGNRKPNKKRSRARIDGAVALMMTLACLSEPSQPAFDARALIG